MHDRIDHTSRPGHHRAALAFVVAVGVALRIANASTASLHPDEPEVMEDAAWSVSPIGLGTAIQFLRRHPRDHLRIVPGTSQLVLRPPSNPGHLGLYPFLMGIPVFVLRPAGPWPAVRIGRAANILADTAALALVPRLVAVLGGAWPADLVATALLATYPPAVVYGSTANLDPLLSLLFLLLVLTLGEAPRRGTWVRAGILTGLCAGAKQTGLIALPWVPLVWLASPPRRLRALGTWAACATLVVVVLVDPLAYLDALRHPTHPFVQLVFDPIANLRGNLAMLAHPAVYYCLSFVRHGEPLAPLLARVHRVVTPAYLTLVVAGVGLVLVRPRVQPLLFVLVPVTMVLSFVQPSDGMWRVHLLCPLLAALVGLELTRIRPAWRRLLLAVALLVGLSVLLPLRPLSNGRLDLGELLLMNPRARQSPGFFAWWLGSPLVVSLRPGVALERTLWLPPGAYDVVVTATGDARVDLDGRRVLEPGTLQNRVVLEGHLHQFVVAFPHGGVLRSITITAAMR